MARALLGDQKGVSALEYAVLAAGIVIALAAAVHSLGSSLSTVFSHIGSSL
jgi:pilus assembly protein Flp/PilA